ncbi:radical SAM protein [Moorella sp. Hama-1]|uniref:radical SAM protein n=1 Tax=Moorella sp. Hama-1 TaxID=2138101 RepID=UPI000D6504E9|nr:radical SAM protein [Moorella sp. Hama-1]BCV21682.1 radical SAM protein [Moorella sp. Hama-1]
MSHVFGPVPSRRLGWSLGVDLVPFKTCSYDCIYCQLGRTTVHTIQRRDYVSVADVLQEVETKLKENPQPDYVTISGSGEPTLNAGLGRVIQGLKRLTSVPVAILTNGSLLYDQNIREDLAAADLVIPSLDAATIPAFEQINRPCSQLGLERIIEGLQDFANMFRGRLWIEVMLARGLNDKEEEITALTAVLKDLPVEKIQLNTVTRPPAEAFARPLEQEQMERIAARLGQRAEIIGHFAGKVYGHGSQQDIEKEIVTLLSRRPCTLTEIASLTGLHKTEVTKYIGRLVDGGLIQPVYQEEVYYRLKTAS